MSSVKMSDPKSFDVKVFKLSEPKVKGSDSKPSAIRKAQADSEADDPRQRRLMVGSLCLLLLTLSIVLWHDRDFWFPDSPDVDADADQPVEIAPAAKPNPPASLSSEASESSEASDLAPAPTVKRKTVAHATVPSKTATQAQAITPLAPDGTPIVATRTVLPPLQVEVVAGDSHRVIRPGNNSVRVDLQPGTAPQPAPEIATAANDQSAGTVTANAAERVQISADTSAAVAKPIKPSYPLLARQMKVQGAVVLQALIGRDGAIQNLRLVSGPQILASAAEDAVRQWRFKPHYQGSEAVETQANITVNFTISTN
jgi:TonB family protein